jgi:hypothetical protein
MEEIEEIQDLPDPATASIRITDSGRLEVFYMRPQASTHSTADNMQTTNTEPPNPIPNWVQNFSSAVDPSFVNELISQQQLTGTDIL